MFRFQFIAVCFVYTVVCTVHVNCDFLANLPTNLDLLKSQIELAKHLLNKADRKDLEGTLLEKGYNDTKCLEQLNDLRIALNSSELWAMKVADSWGKPPSGILSGNLIELGDFDECISVNATIAADNVFVGQYCLAEVKLPKTNGTLGLFDVNKLRLYNNTESRTENYEDSHSNLLKLAPSSTTKGPLLRFGICGPSTCSPEMLEMIIKIFLEQLTVIENVTIAPHTCQIDEETVFQKGDIAAFIFFAFIAFMMVGSTIYDIQAKKRGHKNSLLTAFSVCTNGKKLFACKQINSPDVINCLHGIRAISMIWIIYAHTHSTSTIVPLTNSVHIMNTWMTKYYSMLVFSGVISVDTFFFMSGLLISWSLLKELQNSNGSVNYPLMYLHRYLRLTPLLAICILISITTFKYLGDGPLWKLFNYIAVEENCRQYWWTTLLYIQNYYNPNSMCVGHSWYLSVDMQLFLASPPFIYMLYRLKHKAVPILLVLCASAIGITIWLYWKHNFNAKLFITDSEHSRTDLQVLSYQTTHCRMGAYIIGVLLGYFLFRTNGKKIPIPKSIIILGWVTSLVLILTVIFGNYPLQQIDNEYPAIVYGIYDALSRVVWAMALSFIVFACHFGYGGPINTFLSMSMWQPISRLTYAMYLLHLPLILLVFGQRRTSASFSELNGFHQFLGFLVLTGIVAIFFSLAIESPVVAFERVLFYRERLPSVHSNPTRSHESLVVDTTERTRSSSTYPTNSSQSEVI